MHPKNKDHLHEICQERNEQKEKEEMCNVFLKKKHSKKTQSNKNKNKCPYTSRFLSFLFVKKKE